MNTRALIKRERLQEKLKRSGFTLIELMVAVAVLAVVLTAGVPSFRDLILTNRMAAQTNDFVSSLSFARSEAIKRGARVTVCKSANLSACTTSGTWSQGWIVFVDSNNNATVPNSSSILRVHSGLGNSTLTGNSVLADYASYGGNGFFSPVSGSFLGGTFTLCSGASGSTARTITLNVMGRPTVAKVSCP